VLTRVLKDRFGRPLKNLRISVTSRCNFSCIYCHNEGLPKGELSELSVSSYDIIGEACRRLGILSAKLTGGEPLIRKDIVDIVRALAQHLDEVSITTNGYYLSELAPKLANAGLKRVCVSLPSMDPERYASITGVRALDRVVKGIEVAYECNLNPLTINVVVLKWFTIGDLEKLIDLASRYEARVRLIELEPLGLGAEVFAKLHKPLEELVAYLERVASAKYVRDLHARPVYVLSNGVEVEIVAWFGNPRFCRFCDRVRLSPNGILYPCIARRVGVSIEECLSLSRERAIECVIRKIIEVNELREPFYKY